MKKNIFIILLSIVAFATTGCKNYLDRPPLTSFNDETFWKSESDLRLYANGFYENYFVGYNSSWGTAYAPLRGYTFSDDVTSISRQTLFATSVPSSNSSTSETPAMQTLYSGPNWNFAWVRKSNIMIDRIETRMSNILSDEAFKHWTGIGKFFRAYEYCRLASTFGDVPYFDRVVLDTEKDELFKPRTPRTEVIDNCVADFKYALENVRTSDGNSQYVNKYIVAAFVSRLMLVEASWQLYHMNNPTKAKEYFDLVVEAGNIVINSNKFAFSSNFRDLFGSDDLSKNAEVIQYRTYNANLSVTHCIASYSNIQEGQSPAPNLALAKSFICTDGQPYQSSSLSNANILDLENMIKTRDSRFEATFWNEYKVNSNTLLYADKFISRDGAKLGATVSAAELPAKFKSNTNTNGYPVSRLAEVVLDWIEAKAELAAIGGAAVTQDDIDKSINAIRSRPLDATSIAAGVSKTAPLKLASIPNDPNRDADVSPLLWEIRRERRMEFVFEHTRLMDLRRWKKLDYMYGLKNPDILRGIWVNIPGDANLSKALLVSSKVGKLKVEDANGNIITYDGNNGAEMIGYYLPDNVQDREAPQAKNYLSPVGQTQVDQYIEFGYKFDQTQGW